MEYGTVRSKVNKENGNYNEKREIIYNKCDLFLLGKKILFIAAIAFVGFCSSLIGKGSRFQARVVCVETMLFEDPFWTG